MKAQLLISIYLEGASADITVLRKQLKTHSLLAVSNCATGMRAFSRPKVRVAHQGFSRTWIRICKADGLILEGIL